MSSQNKYLQNIPEEEEEGEGEKCERLLVEVGSSFAVRVSEEFAPPTDGKAFNLQEVIEHLISQAPP